jgi:hypothetical protein
MPRRFPILREKLDPKTLLSSEHAVSTFGVGDLVTCVDATGAAHGVLKRGKRYIVVEALSWRYEGERRFGKGIRVRPVGGWKLIGGRTQHWNLARFARCRG